MAGWPVVAAFTAPALASAQRVQSVQVIVDNDLFGLRGTGHPPDYEYTHGTRVEVQFGQVRRGGRRWVPGVEVGQRIYTPRNDAPEPLPGERPYAGWLYGAATLALVDSARFRSLRMEVGVTGPPALGEPVQNGVHRLLGSRPQRGWDHQLEFEPAFLVRYDDALASERRLAGILLRGEAAAGATLGTLLTGAHGGANLSLGNASRSGLYGSAGVRQDWVLRNLFLDGNTGRSNSTVRKNPWVREYGAAVGVRRGRFDFEYAFVVRGREYHTQQQAHRYGSLRFTLHRRIRLDKNRAL